MISSNSNTLSPGSYVPFIGTSVVRDGQLLLERLYYSLDYPVRYFIVVVSERTWASRRRVGALGYELQHMHDYADNVVIVTCAHAPAVTEGWNAVFHTFPDEPWGVYNARDTAWQPGALAKLSGHMWQAVRDDHMEVAYFNWTIDINMGIHNAFAMTKKGRDRFGLFDENIYPAFAEDDDFRVRQGRMVPPMKVYILRDVQLLHGAARTSQYMSGFHTTDEFVIVDNEKEEARKQALGIRQQVNNQYLYRKWGCPGGGPWFAPTFKTPFNKSVPVWYWETSKRQRQMDVGLQVNDPPGLGGRGVPFLDAHGAVIYRIPEHYSNWTGYLERALPMCRVTGKIGIVRNTSEGIICI
ncbi:hypothetical protein OEZ85_003279 [Tetradesmus obliquus]|uniref:Nucleotide-diphospho-sugar transferase domain-containing protein n=1 Tax=Tetradesmus obliquus TaxID=3088 RepID=A0ABY8U0Q9_TETOB|nr:hypothetical protein OEZ85_003279 [Tetradesmus obliquus]